MFIILSLYFDNLGVFNLSLLDSEGRVFAVGVVLAVLVLVDGFVHCCLVGIVNDLLFSDFFVFFGFDICFFFLLDGYGFLFVGFFLKFIFFFIFICLLLRIFQLLG